MISEVKTAIRLSRINLLTEKLPEIIGPFLAGKNQSLSVGKESLTAFNILERFHYNIKGMRLMVQELGYNHNMAVPLSQIFRVMVYDIIVSYWLFGPENKYDARMLRLNGDFIKKNSTAISTILSISTEVELKNSPAIDPQKMQHHWKGWAQKSPDNFTTAADGSLQRVPVPGGIVVFKTMAQEVTAIHTSTDVKSLPLMYDALSQQAHISTFSKEIIYSKYESNCFMFDSAFYSTLKAVLFLLDMIPDAQPTSNAVQYLMDTLWTAEQGTTKLVP